MDTKPSRESGSDKPSSQSAGRVAQRSRLSRTLIFAGVFALVAMVFVPSPRQGYRLIFDTSDTSVAFFQLLLNVTFAALAGAIVANLSKRALYRVLYVIGACIAIAAVGVGVFALKQRIEHAAYGADSDERYADRLLQWKESQYGQRDRVKEAEDNLRNAAKQWRRAWRSGEVKRVEARADEVANMNAADRSRINQGLPKPTPKPLFKPVPAGAGGAGIFSDLLPDVKPEANEGQPTAPIRKALPVSPTPILGKSPTIPQNHD